VRFNPFDPANLAKSHLRVDRLRRENPALDQDQLTNLLITTTSRYCALIGALSALPAIIPGLGTAVSVLGGGALDIGFLGYLLARLVVEIGLVYGRDPAVTDYYKETLLALAVATGASAVTRGIGRAVGQLSMDVIWTMARKAVFSFGVRAAEENTLARLIPLLGLVAAGGLNYFLARGIGRKVHAYYRQNDPATDDRDTNGQTYDAAFRVDD